MTELCYSPIAIEEEYHRLGHTKGWRLFTCPAKNIETATIGLVTINPGGVVYEESRWETKNGSAYENERWRHGSEAGNAPLQKQIKALFDVVGVKPADALTGYLVPFRSQSWAHWANKHNP